MSRNACSAVLIVLMASACSRREPTREGAPLSQPALRAECYSSEVLPDDSLAEPVAIDDRGRLLVTSFGAIASYIWDGTRHDLHPPPGLNAIAATMNRRGEIAGISGSCDEDGCVLKDIGLYAWRDFEPIPLPLPGGTVSQRSVFINELGHVAGTFHHSDGTEHAFLLSGGTPIDLGTGIASGINDADDVLGILAGQVVIWRGAARLDLGRPAEMRGTEFFNLMLNRGGQVAATSPGPTPYNHAFVWSGGSWTDITASDQTGFALGLNDRGDVVGWGSKGTLPFVPYAFRWNAGTLTKLTNGEAHGVNQRGQIVGVDSVRKAAFVWDEGTMIQLPTPVGWAGEPTSGTMINESDVVVGSVGIEYGARLVVWRPNLCGGGGDAGVPPSDALPPDSGPIEEPTE